MCDRAVWLEAGRIRAIGDAREVAYAYDEFVGSMDETVQTKVPFHPHWDITRAELARLLVQTLDLPLVIPDSASFVDVPSTAWYYPHVETIYANHGSTGYPDQTFRPNQTVSRGEAVTMAVVLSQVPFVQSDTPTFRDVQPHFWYFRHIETAYAYGFIQDSSNGLFHPDRGMNRAEAAALAVRLAGYRIQSPEVPSFTDVPPSEWYYPYVETAYSYGLLGSHKLGDAEKVTSLA